MGLLQDLRAATPAANGESAWMTFKRVMPELVPGFEMTKLEASSGGRVAARGKTPMRGTGRYYWVLVMGGAGTGREDGTREVLLGVDRYQDQADVCLYDQPFSGWVEPTPGAVAVWLAGVLLTEDPHGQRVRARSRT